MSHTKKPNTARLCKLTPGIQKKLAHHLGQGNSMEAASALAGVDINSVKAWMRRGRRELDRLEFDSLAKLRQREAPYVRLLHALEQAIASAETTHINVIADAACGGTEILETTIVVDKEGNPIKKTAKKKVARPQWQASRWWLERRLPQRWGKNRVELMGTEDGKMKFNKEIDLSTLSDEELKSLERILEKTSNSSSS